MTYRFAAASLSALALALALPATSVLADNPADAAAPQSGADAWHAR